MSRVTCNVSCVMCHVSRVMCHNCSVLVADEDVDLNTADTRGHTPLIIGELQLLALYIISLWNAFLVIFIILL